MFDLEQFLSTKLNRKSADGKARVLAFLNHADSVAENYSPTKLAADAAKIIDLKGDQLDAVMQILAYAGILVPREGPNYFIEWIRPADHPVGNPRSRWSYPFGHWKGADRVNWHSVEYWFPGIKTA